MPGLVLPLEQELLGSLTPRLSGQGPDLGPAFTAQRNALMDLLAAQGQTQTAGVNEMFANRGLGRSGSAAAATAGVQQGINQQGQGIYAQLGMQQQQQEQMAIENAIRNALALQGQSAQNYFNQGHLDIAQRQQAQAEQGPGILELLGAGAGLAGSLFGAGGAFPNFFGLTRGSQSRQRGDLLNQLLQAQIGYYGGGGS